MGERVAIPREILEAGLPRVCLLSGRKDGVQLEEITLLVGSRAHMAMDALGASLVSVNASVEAVTLRLPFQPEARERVAKHIRLHRLFSVGLAAVMLVGFLFSLGALYNRFPAKLSFVVWGVGSTLGLIAVVIHKQRTVFEVSCYDQRTSVVGLVIPNPTAAEEVRACVRAFKQDGLLPGAGVLVASGGKTITFECPACERESQVPRAAAGRKGRCPKCKATLRVPSP